MCVPVPKRAACTACTAPNPVYRLQEPGCTSSGLRLPTFFSSSSESPSTITTLPARWVGGAGVQYKRYMQ
jgi:hypothetical protein